MGARRLVGVEVGEVGVEWGEWAEDVKRVLGGGGEEGLSSPPPPSTTAAADDDDDDSDATTTAVTLNVHNLYAYLHTRTECILLTLDSLSAAASLPPGGPPSCARLHARSVGAFEGGWGGVETPRGGWPRRSPSRTGVGKRLVG